MKINNKETTRIGVRCGDQTVKALLYPDRLDPMDVLDIGDTLIEVDDIREVRRLIELLDIIQRSMLNNERSKK